MSYGRGYSLYYTEYLSLCTSKWVTVEVTVCIIFEFLQYTIENICKSTIFAAIGFKQQRNFGRGPGRFRGPSDPKLPDFVRKQNF